MKNPFSFLFKPFEAVQSSKSNQLTIEERYAALNLKLTLSNNKNNQPTAILSRVNKLNRLVFLFNYRFSNEEKRTEYLTKDLQFREKEAAKKLEAAATKQAIRKDFENPFKVGQIFVDSWGYEQTNVDCYQIVEVKPKSVVLKEISCTAVEYTGPMSSNVEPLKDAFKSDDLIVKQVLFYLKNDNTPEYYIKSRHGWSTLHEEGKTYHCSWYA